MRTVVAHALRAELRRVPIGRVVGRWLVAPLISTLAGAGAVGLVVAASASSPTPLEAPADIVLMGFTMVGLVFIVVSAASMYLGEHGSGALLDVYRCLPQRRVALLAKLVWTAMLASGTTAVAVTSTLSSYAVLGPQGAASARALASAQVLVGLPLLVALASMVATSLAVLVRNTPIVIATLVIWIVIGESLAAQLPVAGPLFAVLAPLANGFYAAGLSAEPVLTTSVSLTWCYLSAVTMVMTAAALAVEGRRDVRR
jgi:hypothetical protein